MDDRGASSDRPRVAVLSRDSALSSRLADRCAAAIECVSVASPYEAAAEILAAPLAALVIDFRAIAPAHVRLLEMARQMDVEMLALGALPAGMGADDLSGVRLISREDLPAAIDRLAAPAAPAEAPQPAAAPAPAAEGPPKKKRKAARKRPRTKTAARRKTSRKKAATKREAAPRKAPPPAEEPPAEEPPAEAPAEAAGPPPAGPADQPPSQPAAEGQAEARPAEPPGLAGPPRDLLTQEELNALLEDEP